MRLTTEQKTGEVFEQIAKLNEIFSVEERMPREKLDWHFMSDAVYVLTGRSEEIVAFAFLTDWNGAHPHLMIMAVAPAHQVCGNGRALLLEILRDYPFVPITLTCKVDNVAAQVLYLKSGFRPVRVMPKYYGATNGLLMRREV